MKNYNQRIIPSNLKYKSAPTTDQRITISFDNTQKNMIDFDRNKTVNLAEVYNQERQNSTIFRPTFNLTFLYSNFYTGTTNYVPFRNNLFFVDNRNSLSTGIWKGFPQFYEFDFFRPDVNDGHFTYLPKSAFTYNWSYCLTYVSGQNYDKVLSHNLKTAVQTWRAKEGIPFRIQNIVSNGNKVISFECIASHGLQVGESVELSISYKGKRVFEVYSLGNDLFESEKYIFNIYDVGFTGATFRNGVRGTFRRVINSENRLETTSKYYVREHKVLVDYENIIVTKSGFEKNVLLDKTQYTLSSLTPSHEAKITKKNNSDTYLFTTRQDLNLNDYLDNQKRPLSEIFLTITHRGYSGYFNKPKTLYALKQGWTFNITGNTNPYWSDNNTNVYTSIPVSSYTMTDISGTTKTFYYNEHLKTGDTIFGAFCEWNDYEQTERVISDYYNKINYNQDNFQTENPVTENTRGYYYKPHNPLVIRVFSNYVETGGINNIDQAPGYSFYSETDKELRWRDLYEYGFIDEEGRGVNFPFLNKSHYPYSNVIFKLIPEGQEINYSLTGINEPIKPLGDECE